MKKKLFCILIMLSGLMTSTAAPAQTTLTIGMLQPIPSVKTEKLRFNDFHHVNFVSVRDAPKYLVYNGYYGTG